MRRFYETQDRSITKKCHYGDERKQSLYVSYFKAVIVNASQKCKHEIFDNYLFLTRCKSSRFNLVPSSKTLLNKALIELTKPLDY